MNALSAPVPPGWERAGEIDGVPLWRWRDGPFHAATRDMDQLLFIGAALTRFDQLSGDEFREYVAPFIRQAIINGRWHQPDDDIEVIHLSPAEWDKALQNSLNALKLTWEDLVEQARIGDFSSLRARKLWLMAGRRGHGG